MPLCHLRGALINPQGTSSKDPEDTDPASPSISGDTGCHPPLLLLPGGLAVDPQGTSSLHVPNGHSGAPSPQSMASLPVVSVTGGRPPLPPEQVLV